MPENMNQRLFILNMEDKLWLDKAIDYAEVITKEPDQPSRTALALLDQSEAAKVIVNLFFGN